MCMAMGRSGSVKVIIASLATVILAVSPGMTCADSKKELTHEYTNGIIRVCEGGQLIWQQKADFYGKFDVVEISDGYYAFIEEDYEPSYEVGDVRVRVFDRKKQVITDMVDLYYLDEIDLTGDAPILKAKVNKYNFLDTYAPSWPLWPERYVFEEDQFIQVENPAQLQGYVGFENFRLLAEEVGLFVGDMYRICDGKIRGCLPPSEHAKAIRMLRDVTKIVESMGESNFTGNSSNVDELTSSSDGSDGDFSYDYKDGVSLIYEAGQLIWSDESESALFESKEVSDEYQLAILKFKPKFKVGDVRVLLFDREKHELSDGLELLSVNEISIDEGDVILNAVDNKYGFEDPSAPLWPEFYTLKEGEFYEVDDAENMIGDWGYSLLIQESSAFIGHLYLRCGGEIDSCQFQSEYKKALRFLLDAAKMRQDLIDATFD